MNSRCTPHNATGAAGAGTSSRPFRRTSLLINWRAVMARRFWPLSERCTKTRSAGGYSPARVCGPRCIALSAAAWKDTQRSKMVQPHRKPIRADHRGWLAGSVTAGLPAQSMWPSGFRVPPALTSSAALRVCASALPRRALRQLAGAACPGAFLGGVA